MIKYRITPCTGLAVILTACTGGSGAIDISGENRRTLIGSIGVARTLSEKSTVELRYVASAGRNEQTIGEFSDVQLNGIRLDGPVTLRNRYSLQALSATYQYSYFSGERLNLGISPGIVVTQANVSSESESANTSLSDFRRGVGFRLNGSYRFHDKYAFLAEYEVYHLGDGDYWYTTRGLWFTFDWTKNLQGRLGTSISTLDDGEDGNGDICEPQINRPFDDRPEVCNDSLFNILSGGIQIGAKYEW